MQNLLVEDCNVKSLATGLKLGTESTGPYRNITFRRTTILPGTHRGMSLQVQACQSFGLKRKGRCIPLAA